MASAPSHLPPAVEQIFARHSPSDLPLVSGPCSTDPDAARLLQTPAAALFPQARNPQAALSGLLLLLGQWDASHRVSQDIETPDGSYWHAIAHRMEPDASNAAYWFRRVGQHAIFPDLHQAAAAILAASPLVSWRLKPNWDPFLFINWCEEVNHQPSPFPSSDPHRQVATAIQAAEWRLLFSWCAHPSV